MDVFGDKMTILRVYKIDMESVKKMWREEDCSSFVMKGSCVW